MEKIRIYFMEITDLNNQKHRLKSDNYKKILDFVQMYGGKVNGVHFGNRLISKDKFGKIVAEDCFK